MSKMNRKIENELPKMRLVFRGERMNAEGKSTLNYFVRFEGKTIKKPTSLFVKAKNWSSKKSEVIGSTKEIQRISVLTNERKAEFERYFLDCDARGVKITRIVIDNFFEDKSLDAFFSYYDGICEKRTELSQSMKDKYKLCASIRRLSPTAISPRPLRNSE